MSQNASFSVLLVEEDPKQSEIYSELIREVMPCTVDVVAHVDAAISLVSRSNYHLIVLDLGDSSRGEGSMSLAVLEQLKRLSPVTSLILLSDRATVEEAVAAIRLGAEDYLKKPFSPDLFKLAVKRGLDRKMVLGEERGVSEFVFLLSSCQMISASLDQKKIFGIVRGYLARELQSIHSAVYTLDPTGKPTRVEDHYLDLPEDPAMQEVLDLALQAAAPFSRMIEEDEVMRFVERGQLTPGFFVMRFKCTGTQEYFCVCLSPRRPESIESFESRLRMIRAQTEVTGRNISQYLGVQKLAFVDDVTGLYNTRYLNYVLDREIAQFQKTGKPFAILFIDVDRFKGVNDSHGHLIGSKILHEMGNHLKRFVREADTVFRYGGDEFVAILSPCDMETAKNVAERFRKSVEAQLFLADEGLNLKITISIGVAIFPDHAQSKRAIIEAADNAMYSSKKTTRNSVTVATIPGAKVQNG